MKPINIDRLISDIKGSVDRHQLDGYGRYARWLWGEDRNLGLNEYGCADAANILYTIGAFPRDIEERRGFVQTLQSMQDPESGLFSEPTHHYIHTTAHCTAALELFDAAPLYPCTALLQYTTREGLYRLLEEEINWNNPWRDSHKGAGILVALTLTDAVGLEWKEWYFDWMWRNSDPESGFILYGDHAEAKPHHIMAGGFHYMFNHEAERRPYRYPERIIDYCLELMKEPLKYKMIYHCNFIDVDVIFSLNRAMRQSPHRFYEAREAIEKYAEAYIDMLCAIDPLTDSSFNDLHTLFGAVCCLSELQVALPGKILTTKPLRSVLDRRPFI